MERDVSFLGEHLDTQPPSFKAWKRVLEVEFEMLHSRMKETHLCHHECSLNGTSPPMGQIQRHGEHGALATTAGSPLASLVDNIGVAGLKECPSGTPPPNLRIPKIVKPKKGQMGGLPGWKQAVQDWESADPQRGHNIALKDWDPQWLTGEFKSTFGQLYYQRKLIATEYIERYSSYFGFRTGTILTEAG